MVLPYINMNPPRAYTCSPSWTLLPPPAPYYPSRSSQCTSPKHPVSNLDWQFVSYMILYMFQYHSPKSSPPIPLPHLSLFILWVCYQIEGAIVIWFFFFFFVPLSNLYAITKCLITYSVEELQFSDSVYFSPSSKSCVLLPLFFW